MRRQVLGESFQVEVIYASRRRDITDLHFCIRHKQDNPVPFREATTEEVALDSLEKVRAVRLSTQDGGEGLS